MHAQGVLTSAGCCQSSLTPSIPCLARDLGLALRLKGGRTNENDPLIHPEYAKALQDPSQVSRTGQAVGSVEADDVCAKLPWPEGAEGKRESFEQYQKEYQQAKEDFSDTCSQLSLGSQQQAVHKITLKALRGMEDGSKAYVSHGRLFMQNDVPELVSTLEYQTDKLLEEAICDLQDKKEELSQKIRRLETDMQDVLNNVFRGRFQLFMDQGRG